MTLDEALEDLIQQPDTLKRILAEPGRSQSGLARRLGLDASGVNRLVNGGRQLKAREIAQIRSYLEDTKPSFPSLDAVRGDVVARARDAGPQMHALLKEITSQAGQKVPGRPTPQQWKRALDLVMQTEGWERRP